LLLAGLHLFRGFLGGQKFTDFKESDGDIHGFGNLAPFGVGVVENDGAAGSPDAPIMDVVGGDGIPGF
jgi:hypothetical protein